MSDSEDRIVVKMEEHDSTRLSPTPESDEDAVSASSAAAPPNSLVDFLCDWFKDRDNHASYDGLPTQKRNDERKQRPYGERANRADVERKLAAEYSALHTTSPTDAKAVKNAIYFIARKFMCAIGEHVAGTRDPMKGFSRFFDLYKTCAGDVLGTPPYHDPHSPFDLETGPLDPQYSFDPTPIHSAHSSVQDSISIQGDQSSSSIMNDQDQDGYQDEYLDGHQDGYQEGDTTFVDEDKSGVLDYDYRVLSQLMDRPPEIIHAMTPIVKTYFRERTKRHAEEHQTRRMVMRLKSEDQEQ